MCAHNLSDKVCDYRCGSGIYGDLHCNWRGFGQTCRFCFHDAFKAHLADEVAKVNGTRVIECATHEPPSAIWSDFAQEVQAMDETTATAALEALAASKQAPTLDAAAGAALPYIGNITRGEICAFMVGYFEFFSETEISVSSVTHFMPGMRVRIATTPRDFHVFNR